MKRFTQFVCIVLVLIMVLSTTAFAVEAVDSRASNFFMASSVYFWHVSGSQYQIWFDVTSKGGMDELGAKKIVVERSTDEVNWESVKTYKKEDYSQMTEDDTTSYANCVSFTATSGYSYRAIVDLYAHNSSGTGVMTETTAVLDLR